MYGVLPECFFFGPEMSGSCSGGEWIGVEAKETSFRGMQGNEHRLQGMHCVVENHTRETILCRERKAGFHF